MRPWAILCGGAAAIALLAGAYFLGRDGGR